MLGALRRGLDRRRQQDLRRRDLEFAAAPPRTVRAALAAGARDLAKLRGLRRGLVLLPRALRAPALEGSPGAARTRFHAGREVRRVYPRRGGVRLGFTRGAHR